MFTTERAEEPGLPESAVDRRNRVTWGDVVGEEEWLTKGPVVD